MKKVLCLLVALLMVLCMAGCKGGSEAPKATTAASITFLEDVLVDNQDCVVKITGIDPQGEFGYTLNTYLENKSQDRTFIFSVVDSTVNGVAANCLFGMELAPGEKVTEGICVGDEQLQEALGSYTDIALSFLVYDAGDWSAEPVASFTEHIYPCGEDKATVYTRKPVDTDQVIVDNDQVSITVIGYEQNEYMGYQAKLFLVNKTEANVTFGAEQVSLNGIMADPYFSAELSPGQSAFTAIQWDLYLLEEYEMSQVEEISMVLFAYDQDAWSGEYLANESVVLNPPAPEQ